MILILTLSLLCLTGGNVYAQFDIDNTRTEKVKSNERKYRNRYAKRIISSWVDHNMSLGEKVLEEAVKGVDTVWVPRYMAKPESKGSTKLKLAFDNRPVGYVEVHKGETSLGWAMVGEKGNYIVIPNETPEFANGGTPNEKSVRAGKLREILKENNAFVVAGIGQEGVFFYQHENRVMELDVDTQYVRQVVAESYSNDPEFARINRRANRPLAIATTAVGGSLVVGVLLLIFLL